MPEEFPKIFKEIQPDDFEAIDTKEILIEILPAKIYEMVEGKEFPFPGIEKSAYEEQKALDEECPGFCTPIDDLIKRFQSEGIKVVVLENGSQFIIPAGGPDSEDDRIRPRILERIPGMDDGLEKLIILDRAR